MNNSVEEKMSKEKKSVGGLGVGGGGWREK